MDRDALKGLALATVEACLRPTERGLYFAAGAKHFRTLWVRDFCHAVPGLLRAGFADTVRSQLSLFAGFVSEEGFLPRGVDSLPPQLRVILALVLGRGHGLLRACDGWRLKPEYFGEHGTLAFDSNLLFLRALCQWSEFTDQPLLLKTRQLERLLRAYDPYWRNGLLRQPSFSDWQDSARRSDAVLLTQLLYVEAVWALQKRGLDVALKVPTCTVVQRIAEEFWDAQTQLFNERPGRPQIALDSHILILNRDTWFSGFSPAQTYSALRASPLWTGPLVPGIPVAPAHDPSEISWTAKLVGLRGYHDGLIWGWLCAEAFRLAEKFGDSAEAERILTAMRVASRDAKGLHEIYDTAGERLTPYQTRLYKSEGPFLWTAAKWLEVL